MLKLRILRAVIITSAAVLIWLDISNAIAGPDFFPNSSYRRLVPAELELLDCYGLWHARNEIFARNGYRFATSRGQAEFGTGGWTKSPTLNANEQANIALIKQFEKAYCS